MVSQLVVRDGPPRPALGHDGSAAARSEAERWQEVGMNDDKGSPFAVDERTRGLRDRVRRSIM
jgi:hypothetical protein